MSSLGTQKVIVADDDTYTLKKIKHLLEGEGYDVRVAFDGEAALRLCDKYQPDLLISEINIDGLDGLSLLQKIRQNHRLDNMKVIILTSSHKEGNEVRAFDLGANDFLYKPLRPNAFILRMKRKLATTKEEKKALSILRINGLELDSDNGTLIKDQAPIPMPRRTFELLFFLAQNPGVVYNRFELLDRIWGNDATINGRTVDVHIRKIREKVGRDYIVTFKGIGYKFNSTYATVSK
ncbi:response regulator transcription factor [Roseivirga sp. BDSF3-8]|uniref:response regulator transcription factor n=1 Tax=Roseivirga sp. BDSF3-8 TaxID=3241598 RepID=UPI0035321C8C